MKITIGEVRLISKNCLATGRTRGTVGEPKKFGSERKSVLASERAQVVSHHVDPPMGAVRGRANPVKKKTHTHLGVILRFEEE
ncbi:hypothetical protein C4D60_Mb00t13990 [Musa balbisiana]|uniref:Ribosomal protein L2 C-terminal domain-containing protein n=1 Tax=Musa balbisiana TaxID=52838 RepID=A0A4S8I4N6_MUSBA|nr:hypothetical protein C4D60_Mb00t13990 [Musa balbisiana]